MKYKVGMRVKVICGDSNYAVVGRGYVIRKCTEALYYLGEGGTWIRPNQIIVDFNEYLCGLE